MIIGKEFKFEAAHCIPGHAKCGRVHGHTYKVTVEVSGVLTKGMVMDLHDLSRVVNGVIQNWDHETLNMLPEFKDTIPTCEVIAIVLFDHIKSILKEDFNADLSFVKVQEGDGGYAIQLW